MNAMPNAVVATTTLVINGVTYTTSLMVQTYKLAEVSEALDLAWAKTREAATNVVIKEL